MAAVYKRVRVAVEIEYGVTLDGPVEPGTEDVLARYLAGAEAMRPAGSLVLAGPEVLTTVMPLARRVVGTRVVVPDEDVPGVLRAARG